jgi:hypothetical protein
VKIATFVAIGLSVAFSASAQRPAEDLFTSETLREALTRSDFADGVLTNNGPDLDRKLTSSDFGFSQDTFVAGYYFQDELKGLELGPMHVSLFDRGRREWIHEQNLGARIEKLGLRVGGSVTGILVTPQIILLDTHATPSAGFTVVLNRSLQILGSLGGYGPHAANDGSIWYHGNMVHFADVHQETLKFFDLTRRTESDVFPGSQLSAVARAYQRKIKAAVARLPADHPAHQRVDDFDRSIQFVTERNATSFGFMVTYRSFSLQNNGVDIPDLMTIARCDRERSGGWSCTERELEQVAREAGVRLDENKETIDRLVNAVLDRRTR